MNKLTIYSIMSIFQALWHKIFGRGISEKEQSGFQNSDLSAQALL